ncbi:universal stress protein [Biostraticola tofi]|uniref:Nucleotide-binding universal stress UspA family protein n=1 Tax=Biostraticola tofi TaxID=466109 RepID=A0A4R3YVY8_9GAMM|nr:universal stress protein [Biostraticola tofi]TCV96831.1 nucleotide-binding universal stress UspA family protein [Biostraticola tofi]
MYQHILLSTDGSDVAQQGIDQGLSLAQKLGAKVTIITVTEQLHTYAGPAGGAGWIPAPDEMVAYEAGRKEAAERVLAKAKAAAGRLGVEAQTIHRPDALPAEAIIATARERGCNLIVMSSHGRRGLDRLLLGSQTSEVLAQSPIPVLVIR